MAVLNWIYIAALLVLFRLDISWAFQVAVSSTIPKCQHATLTSGCQDSKLLASSSSSSSTRLYSSTNNRGGGLTLLSSRSSSSSGKLHKDVVIVGGGLAGLSAALHLSQLDPTRQITILEKSEMLESPTGSFAAAGMLAPQSERLPKGHYLDLCMASKRLFPDFCQQVERLAREAGDEGAQYLVQDSQEKSNGLEPWNVGYVAAGGFLAPAFAGDNVATWAPPDESGSAMWLDALQVRELEPSLSSNVVGGWWFPEDASVDARRLVGSLKAACIGAGVQFLCGKNYEVSSLDLEEGKCKGLWLKTGKYISANALLVANGSWMRTLLPVPIEPHKGQSLSLRMPKDQPPILRRVLFAQDSYIVPKADGRIVIGATVEAGSYDGKVTPAGIMHILSYALELVPGLADLPLEETWAGLRPTTPDKGPILGETPWKNLYLAGGYWRNGVLLAPKTGELLASLIAGVPLDEQDQIFLKSFAWDRFTSAEGGTALAANARYAASLYPVHKRKSGVGISAAVGTELGSYSTAVSARDERRKDRESLWGNEDAFEKAALMGKQDGSVFSFGEDGPSIRKTIPQNDSPSLSLGRNPVDKPTLPSTTEELKKLDLPHFLDLNPELDADATDSPAREERSSADDIASIYKTIQRNKAMQAVELEESTGEVRPDPGFRIYHVDQETGEQREVPPYTSPGDFLNSIQKNPDLRSTTSKDTMKTTLPEENNPTFDGYQVILEAAAKDNNIEETMRQARMKNRLDSEPMIYAAADAPQSTTRIDTQANGGEDDTPKQRLSAVYDRIRNQKAQTNADLSEAIPDNRPDPSYRIYHVDADTDEHREVPPYTTPGEFLDFIDSPKSQVVTTATPGIQLDMELKGGIVQSNGTRKARTNEEYSAKTYDGYQDIIKESSLLSEQDRADATREARRKNRLGTSQVDEDGLFLKIDQS